MEERVASRAFSTAPIRGFDDSTTAERVQQAQQAQKSVDRASQAQAAQQLGWAGWAGWLAAAADFSPSC